MNISTQATGILKSSLYFHSAEGPTEVGQTYAVSGWKGLWLRPHRLIDRGRPVLVTEGLGGFEGKLVWLDDHWFVPMSTGELHEWVKLDCPLLKLAQQADE